MANGPEHSMASWEGRLLRKSAHWASESCLSETRFLGRQSRDQRPALEKQAPHSTLPGARRGAGSHCVSAQAPELHWTRVFWMSGCTLLWPAWDAGPPALLCPSNTQVGFHLLGTIHGFAMKTFSTHFFFFFEMGYMLCIAFL